MRYLCPMEDPGPYVETTSFIYLLVRKLIRASPTVLNLGVCIIVIYQNYQNEVSNSFVFVFYNLGNLAIVEENFV